jgi:hypothetical protein
MQWSSVQRVHASKGIGHIPFNDRPANFVEGTGEGVKPSGRGAFSAGIWEIAAQISSSVNTASRPAVETGGIASSDQLRAQVLCSFVPKSARKVTENLILFLFTSWDQSKSPDDSEGKDQTNVFHVEEDCCRFCTVAVSEELHRGVASPPVLQQPVRVGGACCHPLHVYDLKDVNLETIQTFGSASAGLKSFWILPSAT